MNDVYSPAWPMDTELAYLELGVDLVDPYHVWSMCVGCFAYTRIGYCKPLRMHGIDTCSNCTAHGKRRD